MASDVDSPILIVEDDREIREAMRDALEDAGYHVTVAQDGRDALDKLASMDRPGLILLDLMMPVMSGPELLEVLREDRQVQDIPVVIVSAYSLTESTSMGIAGFLPKPFTLNALLDCAARFCH
jgi:CheY-like chemotaxis protein